MKNLLFVVSIVMWMFSSCTFDNSGNPHITTFGWIIIVAIPVLFIIMGASGSEKKKKTDQILLEKGLKQEDIIFLGTYIGGHPDLDDNISFSVIYPKNNILIIAKQISELEVPVEKCSIAIESIKDVAIENASTIENKVTLGRVLLVGVFALAWKKKNKNELAFISINWFDGKFEHSTLFSFEGKDAAQKANTARNRLIKIIR